MEPLPVGKESGQKEWLDPMLTEAQKEGFLFIKPYKDLSKDEKSLIWNGGPSFAGIHAFFRYIESKAYKIQNRVLLSRYEEELNAQIAKGLESEKMQVLF